MRTLVNIAAALSTINPRPRFIILALEPVVTLSNRWLERLLVRIQDKSIHKRMLIVTML